MHWTRVKHNFCLLAASCDTLFKRTARGVDRLRSTQLAWADPGPGWLNNAPRTGADCRNKTLSAGTRRNGDGALDN